MREVKAPKALADEAPTPVAKPIGLAARRATDCNLDLDLDLDGNRETCAAALAAIERRVDIGVDSTDPFAKYLGSAAIGSQSATLGVAILSMPTMRLVKPVPPPNRAGLGRAGSRARSSVYEREGQPSRI